MTQSAVVTASEVAVSQIMAALRRLAWKRVSQEDKEPTEVVVYSQCRMDAIITGILDEISPVQEAFTRGESRDTLEALVGQGKITLEKHPTYDLYTLMVCSLTQQ